jgi:hypothetical protein
MGKIFSVHLDEYKLLRIEYYRVRYIHVVGKIELYTGTQFCGNGGVWFA